MKISCFGKRQCFPSVSVVWLAAGVVPSFDTTSLPGLLADTAARLFWKLHCNTRSKNRWKSGMFYRPLECAPRAVCTTARSGLQEQKPLLGASCGIWQSTASICQLFSRQMTTFHPAPRYHPPEMEAISLLMRDLSHLFLIHEANVCRLTPNMRETPITLWRSAADIEHYVSFSRCSRCHNSGIGEWWFLVSSPYAN